MTDETVPPDLAEHAKEVIRRTRYLVLGTVDAEGRPWTTPVYFAPGGDRTFYWVSATDARHSVNLAADARAAVTVFDSTVLPHHGRAVYGRGEARELAGADIAAALEHYPRPSEEGVTSLGPEDVSGSSGYLLYAFVTTDLWVLCPREPRQPCALHGLATDHRVALPEG